jgi:hypothetical protein
MGAPAAFGVLLHLFDEVGDDLGVGLGDELVALGGEFALQVEIVLDNAVVDDDDAAGAVAMGWAFSSVGRPCVAQRVWPMPKVPSSGCSRSTSSRLASLPGARRTSSVERRTAHGDARRVVAAVFQAPQPLDDDRNYLLGTDITDDSAHASNRF